MLKNTALLRPRYQSGAVREKSRIAIKMEKDHRGIFQRMPFHQLDISEGKNDNGKEQLMDQELFNPQSSSVSSSRIIYTPSTRSNSEQFFYFGICCLPYCCVIVIFYCTAIRATVRKLLGRETVVAGIAVIVVHLISPRYSSWNLSENHCGVQEELADDILLPQGCSA